MEGEGAVEEGGINLVSPRAVCLHASRCSQRRCHGLRKPRSKRRQCQTVTLGLSAMQMDSVSWFITTQCRFIGPV